MNRVILSAKYPIFSEKLTELGYEVTAGETVDCFIPYERDHADMQCLIIGDTAFVLSRCKRLIKELSPHYKVEERGEGVTGKYPANVALNAAVVGKSIIARLDSLDEKVKEYCKNHGYELINVHQGYAKCSCAIVSDSALITADKGIYNSLKETNIEVLLIEEGRAKLQGAGCGFIGGASGLCVNDSGRKLYFSGSIEAVPEYERIKEFCEKHGTAIESLSDTELTDIGGMMFC